MDKQTYFSGTGRRKEAVAQVKLFPGKGAIVVNGAPYEDRFVRFDHRRAIMAPLVATESMDKFNAVIKVTGGGDTGQSEAIGHGIARALLQADEGYKPALKQGGLLSRDPRTKERKKPGLKRARKAPQYTKR